jgi:hypothetical protein
MRATCSKIIDGVEFELTQLGPKEGRNVLLRLTKCLGPALLTIAGDGKSLGDIDHLVIAGALGQLAEKVSEEDLDYLCLKFGEVSKARIGPNLVPLSSAMQDQVFAGELLLMFKWLIASAEVSFASFLAPLRAMQARTSAKVAPASSSPTS